QRPAPDEPEPAVLAALDHVGRSPALLAIAPIEDLLGEAEQPNLPGTTREHPNWQRRLAAPLDDLLQDTRVTERLSAIAQCS
ncbi:MAG: 4-alpha-glucanotransferase, partial [Novosphingobium sp.]